MLEQLNLVEGIDMRLLGLGDAKELAAAYSRNRDHLRRWEPSRQDAFFTEAWQFEDIAQRIASSDAGNGYSFGLFDGAAVVGRFTLAGIVRGPFQSAGLGYWVDGDYAGRGLATATVRTIIGMARDDLGLHRIEASTLPDNRPSQRVLLNAGFQKVGMAPQYLKIAGVWQDHNLYQTILHDQRPLKTVTFLARHT
ncbi:GNAT family N-acetyltransferase [Subtercola boreus]|uniref:GNAT family N-acetyltransferase n=1 Tax=Subtercola boreus TaxID=120213 RepID=A0A3E0VI71_9MICO|nr:GNAT family protein [Subtercola boreus]RFA09090.1 GNAT family N-acetyltransferase [Subtercola boreus]TQL53905.1 [SSU ribosomal protein S5P]-alanine acetyltransferase [Subtercola boreus]